MSDGKKFHVNVRTGEMGKCEAKIQCPWAKADPENVQHYESMQETFEAFEAAMEEEKFSNTVSKKEIAPARKERHLSVVPDAPTVSAAPKAPEKSFAEMSPEERTASVEKMHAERVEAIKKKYPALENPAAPRPEDSKILKMPQEDSNDGYMGGHKFVGGKYREAVEAKRIREGKGPNDYVSLGQNDLAPLIREDLKAAVKAGELPSDLGYTVRKDTGSMVSSLTIVVGKKEGRKIVPVDNSYRYRSADRERMVSGDRELSKHDELAISNYERWHDERELERVPTDESQQVENYLKHLGNQWAQQDINHQVDYYHSYGDTSVRWKDEWD